MVKLTNQICPLVNKWSKAIKLQSPKLMADFYCEEAVLVGTYSKPYEIGKPEILKYFQDFLTYLIVCLALLMSKLHR